MANPRTIARLEARILERAAYCLQFELADPRGSFITLTRVKLSSDLSVARIYYSVLGGPSEKSKAGHMLEHAGGFIQRQVARVLELRRMPRLVWQADESAEQAADIARLIREARERDMAINPALRDEPPVESADPRAERQVDANGAGELGDEEEPLDEDELAEDEDAELADEGELEPPARG